jgi:putative Holliday junction resolvase
MVSSIKNMRILGVDYGTKRIGIAMTDEGAQMAFPKLVLQNDSKLVENFKKIITENEIKTVVLGESKDFKMVDNEIMKEILDFRDVLEKELNVDVVMYSEIYSSAQAEFFQGKTDLLDASAAAIILQSYLESRKNKK